MRRENILKKAASFVKDKTGELPALSIREGETISELKKLIDEEKNINVLVLAASADLNNKNPGPIITSLVSNEITIICINLSLRQLKVSETILICVKLAQIRLLMYV